MPSVIMLNVTYKVSIVMVNVVILSVVVALHRWRCELALFTR